MSTLCTETSREEQISVTVHYCLSQMFLGCSLFSVRASLGPALSLPNISMYFIRIPGHSMQITSLKVSDL